MKQPNALRLAEFHENALNDSNDLALETATELRRQHAELEHKDKLIAELVEALEQMRNWMPIYPATANGIVGGREAHAASVKAATAALSKAKEN